MTIEISHYRELVNHKRKQAEENRESVFHAVRQLGNPSPVEIDTFLKKEKEKEITKRYENGEILKNEIQQIIKEECISVRTIMRCLQYLVKRQLVEHRDKRYHLSAKASGDLRYWAEPFGGFSLSSIMSAYHPRLFKFAQNVDELINVFGIYTLHCFIEASRPVNIDIHDDSSVSNIIERDTLARSWIENIFQPFMMFNYFLAVMENLPDDDAVQRIRNNAKHIGNNLIEFVDDRDQKFIRESANDFMNKRLNLIAHGAYRNVDKPTYELDKDVIKKITDILEKRHKHYYDSLLGARSDFIAKGQFIKELSVPKPRTVKDLKLKTKK